MGVLVLDRVAEIVVEDDLLEHLFAVIVAKLRRHEPVLLSWHDATGQAQQVFANASTTVRAEYDGEARHRLDRAWLERLMVAANSTAGIAVAEAGTGREAMRIPTPEVSEPIAPEPRIEPIGA